MALNDSLSSLATHAGITVTRTAEGTYTNGIYAPGATSAFTIDAVIQPAFNMNRIIGGADLGAKFDNQRTEVVSLLFTTTELKTRTPTTDPDVVTFDGDDWTVVRVEQWNLAGETHYRCIVTKETEGAS